MISPKNCHGCSSAPHGPISPACGMTRIAITTSCSNNRAYEQAGAASSSTRLIPGWPNWPGTRRRGARRCFLPLHVNEQLRTPVLRIMCQADVPRRSREGAYGTPVDHVVLLPSDKKLDKEVLPTHTMRIPDKYATPGGASVDIGPLLASFDLADVLSLSSLHKKGEFYVSIVAAARQDQGSSK